MNAVGVFHFCNFKQEPEENKGTGMICLMNRFSIKIELVLDIMRKSKLGRDPMGGFIW